MKTMCPPSYHHNRFMATHALGHMMYSCHKAIVAITGRGHCFHDYTYIIYNNMKTKMIAHINDVLYNEMKYECLKNESNYFVTCNL